MKKALSVLAIILVLISCTKKSNTNQIAMTPQIDYQQVEKKDTINIAADSTKNSFIKTHNIKGSPVKIISARLFKSQYSDHKDIELVYKNVTLKNIKAIRFEWYCENAFDKPASGRNFFMKGKSDGFSSTLLRPKERKSQVWEDFSTDANTIISARAYYVVFSDGTKWKLKK
ncbi:hypothetical protein [Flavobacterium sp. ov086]|uniref:hypothetical protein n=1 Tax=Flavobacterium sp. ov086 TaxID=1761785 RepID=UPI000B6B6A92|nr:hypothetical protein [Flavobacterium sp. ov086]SNR34468.1 hypothetical protein SAMN04487979_103271 [Flavobacterium sp. ov086]